MAAAYRCPTCGAGNPEGATRCRICTCALPPTGAARTSAIAGSAQAHATSVATAPGSPAPPPPAASPGHAGSTPTNSWAPPDTALPPPPPVPVWDPNANAIPLPPPPPPPPPVQQRGASPVAVGAGIVGAVIATLLVAALVAATLGTAKEKAPPVSAWKPFQDPSGSFSVDLPGEPSRKEQDQDTAIGKVRITMWVSEYSDMSVGVGYADYPVAFAGMAVRAGLEGAARGGAAGAGGELLSMNFTSQQGFPAVDFTVSVDEGIVEARAIIYGTRVYVLQTAGSNGTFDAHQRLLQSFTIAT